MNDFHSRRWNLGFVAMRWRHVFWILPLLGLLAGLFVHFLPMFRNTAIGVVQVSQMRSSASGLPILAISDVAGVVEGEKVLSEVIVALDLPGRWGMEGEKCVGELRDEIDCNVIAGTSLVEISVSSRTRAESELIWYALATALQNYYKTARSAYTQAKLDRLAAEVERLEADVDAKRQVLSTMIRTFDLLHRPNAGAFGESPDFDKAKLEFEKAQAELEAAKIKMIAEEMLCRITEDPVVIHEGPAMPAPRNLWEALRPVVVHSTLGIGAGMLLAVVLAYLLELLFPRKRDGEMANPV